jgi:DNA-binding NarL/FixJ family response regulator
VPRHYAAADREVAPLLPLPLTESEWHRVVTILKLSKQQANIVALILRGLKRKQIAEHLGIQDGTMRTYFERIYDRVNVKDCVALVVRVFAAARLSDK